MRRGTYSWRKSSHSQATNCVEWRVASACNGGACIEVGSAFRKSSQSAYNGNCVETAPCTCAEPRILVRDSQDKGGPVLSFDAKAWSAFTAGLKAA